MPFLDPNFYSVVQTAKENYCQFGLCPPSTERSPVLAGRMLSQTSQAQELSRVARVGLDSLEGRNVGPEAIWSLLNLRPGLGQRPESEDGLWYLVGLGGCPSH